jgi:hypothetical protein
MKSKKPNYNNDEELEETRRGIMVLKGINLI